METQRPWITWVGDDFTGSAAVMEVLAFAGIPTVLFTELPDAELMERFAGALGVGIATTARSHGTDWMAAELPNLLHWLNGLNAPILHYKVCSTFDSSPIVGSIGKALDLALRVRPSTAIPLLTGAPLMRRYQAFGNLFVGTDQNVFRLDRHPVMARHPVTPMPEADILRHLAAQTALPGALIDFRALAEGPDPQVEAALARGARILSIDSIDTASEAAAGRLMWTNRDRMGLVCGSQGVEYALVRHWQEIGLLPPPPETSSAGPVAQIAAVSGSVSPVTARQLSWAGIHGFALLSFDASTVCGAPGALAEEEARVVAMACSAAAQGQSPLVHSAAGHNDPSVERFRATLSASSSTPEVANQRIGEALGRILDTVLRATGLRRAVISGGDTSGHGFRQLGLQALVARAPTIPGAALCSAHGAGPHDGLEIALKGGQMGSEDFFGWIREGGGPR